MKDETFGSLTGEKSFMTKPIEQKLRDFINAFMCDYGEDPPCILLGPNEYIDLMAEAARDKYNPWGGIIYPHTYCGIPIRVKKSPGIDSEIRPERVYIFAKESK